MLLAPPPPTPVLAASKPCTVSVQTAPGAFDSEPIAVSGSGFAAGASLDLAVDGATALTGVTAGADGSFAAQALRGPDVAAGERRVELTASDGGTVVARTTARVTALTVKVRPRRAHPQQDVRFSGRGFTADGPLYAHYVRRGKVRRTVRLARHTRGACGRFSVERPQFPFRPKQGVWRVQVDQHAALVDDGPLVNLSIDVKRRPVTGR